MSQQFSPGRDPEPVANAEMVFGQVNQILAEKQAERDHRLRCGCWSPYHVDKLCPEGVDLRAKLFLAADAARLDPENFRASATEAEADYYLHFIRNGFQVGPSAHAEGAWRVAIEVFEQEAPPPDLELPPLTDEEAHSLIRRLARIEDEKAALKVNFEALVKELDARRMHILAIEEERLQAWTAGHLKGNKRSVRTLHGVAGFRTQPARWVVTDEDVAVRSALVHFPEAVKSRLDARALPKAGDWTHLDPETGEVVQSEPPDGLEIIPAEDRFYVKSGAKAEGGDQ